MSSISCNRVARQVLWGPPSGGGGVVRQRHPLGYWYFAPLSRSYRVDSPLSPSLVARKEPTPLGGLFAGLPADPDPDTLQRGGVGSGLVECFKNAQGVANSARYARRRSLHCPRLHRRVGQVSVFRSDVVVSRSRVSEGKPAPRGTRRAITKLSDRSRRSMAFSIRNMPEPLTHMLTLTYPAEMPLNGRLIKRHWKAMRMWIIRRSRRGFWFLEFQKNTKQPHYHVLLTGNIDYKEVARAWWRIVGYWSQDHFKAGTRIERLKKDHAALMYVLKYASKSEQKEVPEGFEGVGRFWGLFGGLSVKPEMIVRGELSKVAPVIRTVKKAIVQGRGPWFSLRKMIDTGKQGFCEWAASGIVGRCLSKLGYKPGITDVGGSVELPAFPEMRFGANEKPDWPLWFRDSLSESIKDALGVPYEKIPFKTYDDTHDRWERDFLSGVGGALRRMSPA